MDSEMNRTAFILAAGLGSRLKDMTQNMPKALVNLNEKKLIEVTLDNLISQNFNNFIINIHHYGDQIIDFINETEKYKDVKIEFSDERDFLYNTGGAILKALNLFKDEPAVLIHNVDIVCDIDLKRLYDDFLTNEDASWLLTNERNNKRKLVFDLYDNYLGRYNIDTKEHIGNFQINDNCRLLSFCGLHFIKPRYFIDFELKPCYVFDLYDDIAKRAKVRSKQVRPSYWYDLGTKEQLKEASEWLSSQK